MSKPEPRSVSWLSSEVVRILKSLRNLPDENREQHAILNRDLATTMIELREHFLTEDSQPDWSGRTWAYRDAVSNLYREAGYSADERSQAQATVRYHIGNILRDKVGADKLADAGILAPSPHDRQRKRRARNAVLMASVATPPDPDAPLADKVATLQAILAALTSERLNRRVLGAPANSADAVSVGKLLTAIRDRSDVLLGELRTMGVIRD